MNERNNINNSLQKISDCSAAYRHQAVLKDDDLELSKRKANEYHRIPKSRVNAYLKNAQAVCDEIQADFESTLKERTDFFLKEMDAITESIGAKTLIASKSQRMVYSDLICFISSHPKFDGRVDEEMEHLLDLISNTSQNFQRMGGFREEGEEEDGPLF